MAFEKVIGKTEENVVSALKSGMEDKSCGGRKRAQWKSTAATPMLSEAFGKTWAFSVSVSLYFCLSPLSSHSLTPLSPLCVCEQEREKEMERWKECVSMSYPVKLASELGVGHERVC